MNFVRRAQKNSMPLHGACRHIAIRIIFTSEVVEIHRDAIFEENILVIQGQTGVTGNTVGNGAGNEQLPL